MDIPKICEKWALVMASGGDVERKMLDNLMRERCIREEVAREFFIRLARKGEPTSGLEARQTGEEVIREDPDTFTCQGQNTSEDAFVRLLRVEDLKALRWRIPDCLKRLGIVDEELISGLPEEELDSLTDEYEGLVMLGNRLSIVWVTDYEVAEDLLDDLEGLVDRLGLTNLVDESYCVVCVHNRKDIGLSIHVPRMFEGWDSMQFELVEDCAAQSGKTKPLTLGVEQGLPEAVHKKCEIIPEQWKLRSIR